MNTILLQKILDILKEGLAHVGDFFKDLFVSDPQDGQVIGYDSGKWKNITLSELAFDVTDEVGPNDIITFSDAAAMPLKSLVANINVDDGANAVNITHAGKNIFSFDKTISDSANANVYITPDGYISFVTNNNRIKYNIKTTDVVTFTATVASASPSSNAIRFIAYYTDGTNSVIASVTTTDTNDHVISGSTTSGKTLNGIQSAWTDGVNTYLKQAQLEFGTTASEYEPFTGATETVALPSSVTSGYVDIISGKGVSGDTPFTVTPVVIKSTTGVNNIFADTGTVSAEYYTKTAGDIKDLVCITNDITSEVTKNTTDFSDVLLKVSQNNKVVSIEIYSATTAAAVNDTFLSNLPKPAMNCKVLLVNTTLGEDGTILGTLKTSGELEIATPGANSFSGLITYVAK